MQKVEKVNYRLLRSLIQEDKVKSLGGFSRKFDRLGGSPRMGPHV